MRCHGNSGCQELHSRDAELQQAFVFIEREREVKEGWIRERWRACVSHLCYVCIIISTYGSVSPGWMSRLALQDAFPTGLTAVTL